MPKKCRMLGRNKRTIYNCKKCGCKADVYKEGRYAFFVCCSNCYEKSYPRLSAKDAIESWNLVRGEEPRLLNTATTLHVNVDATSVIAERHRTHGDAEHVFQAIAQAWNDMLNGRAITAVDVCLMMAKLKHARALFGDVKCADHALDAAGYLELAERLEF